ncbi:MAG: lysophospholipid acyltransferase family protein [Acidimicrobiales bacterium]|jgi:1-acyl-sn-glycerol-3-phosphate acyltransferase
MPGRTGGTSTRNFLWRAPMRPAGADPLPLAKKTGVEYETDWARRYPVRLARAIVLDDLTLPIVWAVARPKVLGRDPLERIEGPVIVTSNHSSHLDTAVLLTSLPASRRHHTVVAAAADYFFDRHWKAAASAFGLGAIPMERNKVNRRSADAAACLIDEGWSLVIFPEGGRSPHGWGQEFKGGAAYLAKRCAVPVVPVYVRGTRAILPKGGRGTKVRLRPGQTEVRFGAPLWPRDGEDARRMSARIEAAVALLADEAETDWWSARLRASRGESPPFRGPEVSPWRRAWALPESADPVSRRATVNGEPGVDGATDWDDHDRDYDENR